MNFTQFCTEEIAKGTQPGVANENKIIEAIQMALAKQKEITIRFVSDSNTFELGGIVEVVNRSKDTTGNKKSDFVLLCCSNHEYPISLKTDDSQYWGSADTLAGEKFRKVIDKAVYNKKITLDFDSSTMCYSISSAIAIKPTYEEAMSCMFGSDILPNGSVIKRTFSDSDFVLLDKILTINCSKIIRSFEDVKDTDLEPYFFLRNQTSRNCLSLGYKGLRPMAMTKSRITQNILVL